MSFPKWLYHATQEAVVVSDEAAEKALGPGWVESPADVKKPVESKKAESHHAAEHPEPHHEAAEKHHKKAK